MFIQKNMLLKKKVMINHVDSKSYQLEEWRHNWLFRRGSYGLGAATAAAFINDI